MKLYNNVVYGRFLSRPNRFIAICDVDGREEICHVKNTGRCRELLVPDSRVVLCPCESEKRKTKFDLVAVYKNDLLVNMDSQAPNRVFREHLDRGNFIENATVCQERKFGNSRFDFYIEQGERHIICEVKGVTLESEGVCSFPDALTLRGQKHLRELSQLTAQGYECWIIFIVQMEGMKYLKPNRDNDPDFAEELERAKTAGVKIAALECAVSDDCMTVTREIPVIIAQNKSNGC